MTTWTEARIEKAVRLRREGYSSSQIADALGGVTRNAVLGKLHRLGISAERTPAKPKRVEAVAVEPAAPLAPTLMPTSAVMTAEPRPLVGVSLDAVANDGCRWPLGDPASEDFRFCGEGAAEGSSYCPAHGAKAYQPASVQRREQRRAAAVLTRRAA